eukprot:NODE_12479_length_392_cov_8.895911_g11821_i0.p1 GENE.NODE_12479_length_392_cov_8.895911_g11821_i0~~NODE_12479_length_392_cov_8.895911_g11821_i0.p1  ORF type:complete len:103 (+),score=9.51 NODE_12479_length_392_cov_8.895911_g11821_i0:48-311(+)
MAKTATLSHSPKDKEAIVNSGVVQMLTEGGVSVDLKQDKALKGKFTLFIDDVTTEFTYEEALESSGEMKPAFIEKIRDWLYAYVANQ